jgi:hypothetical protein
MNKKTYKVIMEAISSGRLKDVDLPMNATKHRRMTVDEIKEVLQEVFEEAQNVEECVPDKEEQWSDAEIENEINWVKALDIKEFFKKGVKK